MQFPNPKLIELFRELTVGRIAVGVLGAAVLATGAIGATSQAGSRYLALPLAHVADRSSRHALEFDSVARLECFREANDIVGVHLETERMARVAHDLLWNDGRPVAFRGNDYAADS